MNATEIIAESAKLRESARRDFTLADALEEVQWLRRTPDGIIAPDLAKRTILVLGTEIERIRKLHPLLVGEWTPARLLHLGEATQIRELCKLLNSLQPK